MSDKPIHPDTNTNTSDNQQDEIATRIERAFRKVMDDNELKEFRVILEEHYLGSQSCV